MFGDSPTIALPDIRIETPPDEAAELDPPVRVLIHNDDVTPHDFVVIVLRAVFHLALSEAERITHTAHTSGLACVAVLRLEEAKFRVGKAHGIARQSGYPLTFTIEPE
jgi:ATP-dependent Clp protease adaptor protein ClpS